MACLKAAINPCLNKARVMFFLGVVCLNWACSKSQDATGNGTEKKRVVAKIYDKEIFASDLDDITASAKTKDDSTRYVNAYLEKLALEKALLQKALGSGLVDMSDIEAKTSEFRNTLINLRFEKEYVKKNLDTNFTNEQVKEYFEKNKMSFVLVQDILRAYYVVVPANIPKLGKLKEIMASDKPQDFEELKSESMRYASTFSIDRDQWFVLPSILKNNAVTLAQAAGGKHIISVEKEEHLHLIRVFDYKFAKAQSPLAFVEENIKLILLNKRKIELLGKLTGEALEEAKQNNKIEIY